MKILSAEQIRRADQFTIENEPISSIDLMERASQQFTKWFCENFDKSNSIKIICGSGNNGGDGLAVGRLLLDKNYEVEVFTITKGKQGSPDFEKNKKRLEGLTKIIDIGEPSEIPRFEEKDIVVDALFGSGLARPVEGLHGQVIESINNSGSTVVSIDISSGLFCDELIENPVAVNANFTVSFQLPKRAFFYSENDPFVGEWNVLDIGLDQKFIFDQESTIHWIGISEVKGLLKRRSRHSHKGNYGHALLIAGSKGKMGAAVLAGKACLHSGVGLLSVMPPSCGTIILQTALPEAMVSENEGIDYLQKHSIAFENYTSIGIGPGLEQQKETLQLLRAVLENANQPLVIDADGLNLLGANRELLEILPENSILTPHPKEFERLAGPSKNSRERAQLQLEFSQKRKVFVILKGGYTSISSPEGELYYNTLGNPGMATAGAGDVLTGIVTALLAQGYSPLQSALLSVFLHAKAGDLAAEKGSMEGLIASDIIANLPHSFRLLSK